MLIQYMTDAGFVARVVDTNLFFSDSNYLNINNAHVQET